MNKGIDIGIPINLERLLETRLLIQAGSGGGKSYALRKVIESIGTSAQQIIIDPEGEFVTLREKFDFMLVGKDGDIPLNLKYAETLAHKILETNVSTIIDLYELKAYERIIFVKHFLDAIINAPKEMWHPCFIHIDEAHIFCPESSKSESVSSVIDLCTRGRKRGFCAVLATQRLSKLHKDAAAECNNKLIGKAGIDIDQKRAGEELGFTSKANMLALRDLSPGEFFAFGPAITNQVTKFKVAPVITTHLQAGKRMVAPPPTPKAIENILSLLSDIPEEAEKDFNTKQDLLDEIARLKKQQTPGVSKEEYQELEDKYDELESKNKKLEIFYHSVSALVKNNHEVEITGPDEFFPSTFMPADVRELVYRPTDEHIKEQENWKTYKQQPVPKKEKQEDQISSVGGLSKGEERVLMTLKSYHPQKLMRRRLAILSNYSPTKSTFRGILSSLSKAGMITYNGTDIAITDFGIKSIGPVNAVPTSGKHLLQYWKPNLPEKQYTMLAYLFQGKSFITKERLANYVGYDPKVSTFRGAVSALNVLGLIDVRGNEIRIAQEFLL